MELNMTGKENKIECSHEDGCPVVRKAVKEILEQLTKLKAYKVSWVSLVGIFAFIISIFGVGTYLFGADVIKIVKSYPGMEVETKQNSKDVAVLYERTQQILNSNNETNTLIKDFINKLDREDNAKKIASKEIKEYNKTTN